MDRIRKNRQRGRYNQADRFRQKDYAEAQLNDSTAKAVFKTDKINGKPVIYTNIPSGDSFAKTLDTWKKEDGFNAEVYYENSSDLTNILWSVGPFILLIVFWIYLARRMTNQGGGGSGGVFNVGKAKAQLFDKDGAVKVTFNDVAGLSEAKQEVEEIVEFLKNPNRYTDLGGKIPKGALLVGPPGTGKHYWQRPLPEKPTSRFLFIWFRFRRNVRRCGSLSCSRSFQTSQRESSVYRLYR